MDKGVLWSDTIIYEGVLQWFDHVERIENDRIIKTVYVGECGGRLQKRWIDTLKDCLKKKRFGCQADKENGV